MCGASSQQESIAAQQQSFSTLLNANYQQNFSAQSQILQNLTNQFTPIAEAGPDQQGFGSQQLASLNTQAGEGVGANYAKATQALNNNLAARGGGNEYLPTGSANALQGQLASSAANQQSQEQLAITNANYTQGRQNWQNATSGLAALGQEYNPTGVAGAATGAGNAAMSGATAVNQANNQWEGELAGVLSGGLSALAGPIGGLMKGGSSAASAAAQNNMNGTIGLGWTPPAAQSSVYGPANQ